MPHDPLVPSQWHGCHQVPKSPQLWDLHTSITNKSIASVSKQNQHYLQSLFIKYSNEFITSNDNIFYKHMTLLVYATTIDSLSLQCSPSHHPFMLVTLSSLYHFLFYIICNSYDPQRFWRPPGPSSTCPTLLLPIFSIIFVYFTCIIV